MEAQERIDSIALSILLCENHYLIDTIRKAFPHLSDFFKCPEEKIHKLGFDSEKTAVIRSGRLQEKAKKEIEWLHKKGYTALLLKDPEYPRVLREIDNPPLVLYCAGKIEAVNSLGVAIVGTRRPSPYGRSVTEQLARNLARRGVVIVSGLARGIDSIAHWGAVKGGQTVAVLGSGLGTVYPKENAGLFRTILQRGAVVSEYPFSSPPLRHHFPQRNRIISGLSRVVVVTEAAEKSGSLITADLALEQNREVMAIPGNITSKSSQGTNTLLKLGAKPVQSWRDVVEELPREIQQEFLFEDTLDDASPVRLTGTEQSLFSLLKPDALVHVDELVTVSRMSVPEVLSALLHLELKDLVFQRPGKFYQRKL
ncbi:MAG: DNA-processing protein DprA [Acidobacteria bacterium]|nr:DNA-processing protein DprA [Acidobacteriota bacterium]MBU4330240.1 DNA-processing protein DprA [Acidobacteriota bacterium]MCG2815584.1 DNA-processing protein DprA [Candidatus Aminicenantes bacterium]